MCSRDTQADGDGRQLSRPPRRRCCGRRPNLRQCLVSDSLQGIILLTVFVVGYMCLGAAVFVELEDPEEHVDPAEVVGNISRSLWHRSELDYDAWLDLVGSVLGEHRQRYCNYEYDPMKQWSFLTALFLCMTAITTIGYGTVTPQSPTGRLFLTFYSVLGIPLFLLFLSNSGVVVAAKTRDSFKSMRKAAKKTTRRLSQSIYVRRQSRVSLENDETKGSFRKRGGGHGGEEEGVRDDIEMTETEHSQKLVEELIEADYRRRSLGTEDGHANPGLVDLDLDSNPLSVTATVDSLSAISAATDDNCSMNGPISSKEGIRKHSSDSESAVFGIYDEQVFTDRPLQVEEAEAGDSKNSDYQVVLAEQSDNRNQSEDGKSNVQYVDDTVERRCEDDRQVQYTDLSKMQICPTAENSKFQSQGFCREPERNECFVIGETETNGNKSLSVSCDDAHGEADDKVDNVSIQDVVEGGKADDGSNSEESPKRTRKNGVHAIQPGLCQVCRNSNRDGDAPGKAVSNGPVPRSANDCSGRHSNGKWKQSVGGDASINHGTVDPAARAVRDLSRGSSNCVRRSSEPVGIMHSPRKEVRVKCENCGHITTRVDCNMCQPKLKKKISFEADVSRGDDTPSDHSDSTSHRSRTDSFESSDAAASTSQDRALSVLAVVYVIYTLGGSCLFMYWEGEQQWDYISSFYFCVTTLTTIGFGDLMLDLAEGGSEIVAWKTIVFILYTLVGLILLSACFSLAQEKLKNVAHKVMARLHITQYCQMCADKCSHCCGRDSCEMDEAIDVRIENSNARPENIEV